MNRRHFLSGLPLAVPLTQAPVRKEDPLKIVFQDVVPIHACGKQMARLNWPDDPHDGVAEFECPWCQVKLKIKPTRLEVVE